MWSHRSRGVLITVLVVACGLGVAVAVSHAAHTSSKRADRATVALQPTNDATRARAERALAASVRIAPSSGATNVAADAPVVVVAANGHIANVRVTSTTGAVVAGMLTPMQTQWQSTAPLAYGETYRVAVTAAGSDHARAVLTSTFRTSSPAARVTASEFPADGLSVGVGQPVVFRFDHFVSDPAARSAVLSHLHVTESLPVLGGWHWFSNDELHFRPESYWPTKEQVTVSWDLRGLERGERDVGRRSGHDSFLGGRRPRFVCRPVDPRDDGHRQRTGHRDVPRSAGARRRIRRWAACTSCSIARASCA